MMCRERGYAVDKERVRDRIDRRSEHHHEINVGDSRTNEIIPPRENLPHTACAVR